MRKTFSLLSSTLLAGSFLLGSCAGSVHYKTTEPPAPPAAAAVVEKGPPPHAPAHGYRHKHQYVVLVYEASLDAYLVEGHPGLYFCDSSFYRAHDGYWQMSCEASGPWKKVSASKVPKGLQNTQHAHAKKNK